MIQNQNTQAMQPAPQQQGQMPQQMMPGPPEQPSQPVQASPEEKKSGRWIWIIVALAVILAGVASYYLFFR